MDLDISDIKEAKMRISGVVRNTNMEYSHTLSKWYDAKIYMKCENHQKTGSFKIRGSYNKISKLKDKIDHDKRIIAASAGNHAQGVAYAATKCGFKSTIVMPRFAPLAKIEATKAYGADVELTGDNFDEAFAYAKTLDGFFIHPYDDIDIIAGQGTLGLEILEQLPEVDIIIVPAGGGGLLSGLAFAVKQIKPSVKIIGVQAKNANAIYESFRAKKRICTDCSNTLADGISVKNPGKITVEIINKYVDDVITVDDQEIASAVMSLIERSKQVVEPAGATTVAALANASLKLKGNNVVCLLSGGNIDINTISNIITRGLVARSRKVELVIKAPDNHVSGGDIFEIIKNNGANILSLYTDRISPDCSHGYIKLYITCEFSGLEHRQLIENKLTKNGYEILNN